MLYNSFLPQSTHQFSLLWLEFIQCVLDDMEERESEVNFDRLSSSTSSSKSSFNF